MNNLYDTTNNINRNILWQLSWAPDGILVLSENTIHYMKQYVLYSDTLLTPSQLKYSYNKWVGVITHLIHRCWSLLISR